MFNVVNFLKDFNINYIDSGKNCSNGWININCPYCKDTSFHLGFNVSSGMNNCWKCGSHNTIDLISNLLSLSKNRSIDIFNTYYTNSTYNQHFKNKKSYSISEVILPPSASQLSIKHKNYLKNRKFNPDILEKKYNLLGTNHLGNYKWRIIIPIYFNNKLVSFQSRDITGKAELRYKSANKNNEIIHHKDILYGIDTANKDTVIIVEGIFDKWRIGDDSVCTFGVSFTQEQVRLISKKWKKVFILYDSDEAGIIKSNKLASQLAGLSIEVEIISLDSDDPGNMSDIDAKNLVKELLK